VTVPTTYPLAWPATAKRARYKQPSAYKARTYRQSEHELLAELKRWSATEITISSNVFDRGTLGKLADPGVAVYFTRRKIKHAIALDRHYTAAENLYAIAKAIMYLRHIERIDASIGDTAVAAFAALPPAPDEPPARPWHIVLGLARPDAMGLHVSDVRAIVEARAKRMLVEHSPDKGGDPGRYLEVIEARKAARAELGGGES
jgi:hypothetical protein